MDKRMALSLKEEFIPDGPSVDARTLKFRRTTEAEVFRCSRPTSYDMQSGQIFCGAVAEYVAFVKIGGNDYVTGLCGKSGHRPPKSASS